jgi:hypothetical protein
MKNHTKIYLRFYNLKDTSECDCVMCGGQATDLHHIKPRGMGGSDYLDYVENLAPLCRGHHTKAEHDPTYNAKVKIAVLKQVIRKVEIDGKF